MTAAEVQARGLERIARGDWDDTPDAYAQVKLYAGWLLRQTGNQDEPRLTHGRHCPCSACAREDWTRITGPCGMHGADCPAVYAPLVAATEPGEGTDG